MKHSSTSIKSDIGLLQGNSLFAQRARKAFPILVRQAHAGRIITYNKLADELEMSNPRNLNYVLGAIGNAILHLRKIRNENIPLINFLVVGKNSNVPGNGIYGFTRYQRVSLEAKSEKVEQFENEIKQIFAYPNWDELLCLLDLTPVESNMDEIELISQAIKNGSSGESSFHLEFKNYLRDNPQIFGLKGNTEKKTEYPFMSADTIDVMFWNKNIIVGVEAKSKISNDKDILRGIFQCVKYAALIEAHQVYEKKYIPFKVVLAIERKISSTLKGTCNQLGVDYIDSIRNE